jgi:hypothetical protein
MEVRSPHRTCGYRDAAANGGQAPGSERFVHAFLASDALDSRNAASAGLESAAKSLCDGGAPRIASERRLVQRTRFYIGQDRLGVDIATVRRRTRRDGASAARSHHRADATRQSSAER